jgi:hypothetical protein
VHTRDGEPLPSMSGLATLPARTDKHRFCLLHLRIEQFNTSVFLYGIIFSCTLKYYCNFLFQASGGLGARRQLLTSEIRVQSQVDVESLIDEMVLRKVSFRETRLSPANYHSIFVTHTFVL